MTTKPSSTATKAASDSGVTAHASARVNATDTARPATSSTSSPNSASTLAKACASCRPMDASVPQMSPGACLFAISTLPSRNRAHDWAPAQSEAADRQILPLVDRIARPPPDSTTGALAARCGSGVALVANGTFDDGGELVAHLGGDRREFVVADDREHPVSVYRRDVRLPVSLVDDSVPSCGSAESAWWASGGLQAPKIV
ncbi:MAG TPA: hypothetical protein VFU66_13690 [Edaphobacter sp.]|nr:hypothetical protein [Edaphobacter sp.]HEU5342301.1 hypothetical protein [Edaphobacter sp.]